MSDTVRRLQTEVKELRAAIKELRAEKKRGFAGIYSKTPKGQKFPSGTRVRIVKDLGPHMKHFPCDELATVEYTYGQKYGGGGVDTYCINIDGRGRTAWYGGRQLMKAGD